MRFCENFSGKQKCWFSLLSGAYNYNIDACVCKVRCLGGTKCFVRENPESVF